MEPITRDSQTPVLAAVRAVVARHPRLVLAVSGGLDSMVLLHAAARVARDVGRELVVATFDHSTGPHAAVAVDLVEREGRRLGLEVRRGRAARVGVSEADWRAARWSFLRREGRRAGAAVATAHTRDDHVETIVLRVLRGAGARGLAALYARTGVVRPFLELPRQVLAEYARSERVPYLDDPTNQSRSYLRNRVRLDLLPAIRRVRPGFGEEMLAVARAAAEWRTAIESLARRFVTGEAAEGEVCVARAELATYDSASLRVLWPAIAAHAGVTLDRRGTLRLAQFTRSGAHAARVQLSGNVEVVRDRETFLVRRREPVAPQGSLPLHGVVEFGSWRLRPVAASDRDAGGGRSSDTGRDPWVAEFPVGCYLTVRAWRPGDRMRPPGSGAARRVKRFFADAGVPGPLRTGWPVVEAGGEIAWVPGVRRGDAATARSGRPVIRYRCERIHRRPIPGEHPEG